MDFDPVKPHNRLPMLPPEVEIESRAVLKACIAARSAVAELKAAGRLIPNQGVLINSIPLLEAQASSEIENIVTTTDQMFLFDGVSEADADPATKEALRYRKALWEGHQALLHAARRRGFAARKAGQLGKVDARGFARQSRDGSPGSDGGRTLPIRGHSPLH